MLKELQQAFSIIESKNQGIDMPFSYLGSDTSSSCLPLMPLNALTHFDFIVPVALEFESFLSLSAPAIAAAAPPIPTPPPPPDPPSTFAANISF